MREFLYKKIDAFTSGKSLGNPAACLYLADDQSLSDDEMLAIAQQHKGFISEVVYCRKSKQSGFDLTYFSSECEVDFCGHGTIACMHSLIKNTPDLLAQNEVIIHTNKKGALTVYNHIPTEDAVFITAPDPLLIGTTLSPETIAKNLGLPTDRIANRYPIDLINAGLTTLIVPIAGLTDEINLFPHEQGLKEFCLDNKIDIILIFSTEAADNQHFAHTRVFAPRFGYLEDPATGSGNSAFGSYLLKNGMWKGNNISIEQGSSHMAFNIVKLSMHQGKVLFGGSATDRIIGQYFL